MKAKRQRFEQRFSMRHGAQRTCAVRLPIPLSAKADSPLGRLIMDRGEQGHRWIMGNWYKNDPVVDGARQRIDKMEALALAAGIHEVPTLWLREKGGGSRVTTPSAKAESF